MSSDQQRDSGSSLDTQSAACLALAEREGYSVLAVVQESFSGAELWARPKLGQIREQIRNREIDALICYTVDRLTRNIAHLMVLLDECERFGVVPMFVMESLDQSPEGKLLMSVRGYVGEVERLRRASSAGLAAVDDLLRMAERLAENAETLPPDHQRAILQAFGVRVTADGRAWEWEIEAG